EARFTSMLCGEFEFATGKRNAIVDALPPCFVVREQDSGMQCRQLAQLMLHEARGNSFGSRAILDKMADTLFVMAVRHYIEHAPERRGLLGALFDPRLVRALEAIHTQPGKEWTVAALADAAHMSRTAFANHFASVLGAGPIEYLTQWRMAEARRLLSDPRTSVAAVAADLGYHTEAAFRRAVEQGHGWYGFALDEDGARRCLDGLRAAADRYARPAALGPLEISVTPRPTRGGEVMDRASADRFAALGVHRLIVMPPRSLDAAGIERFVEKTARELRGLLDAPTR
ncbi:MAG TPA: cupin domain-containing protein, partial [Methylomirabilota bacterium]